MKWVRCKRAAFTTPPDFLNLISSASRRRCQQVCDSCHLYAEFINVCQCGGPGQHECFSPCRIRQQSSSGIAGQRSVPRSRDTQNLLQGDLEGKRGEHRHCLNSWEYNSFCLWAQRRSLFYWNIQKSADVDVCGAGRVLLFGSDNIVDDGVTHSGATSAASCCYVIIVTRRNLRWIYYCYCYSSKIHIRPWFCSRFLTVEGSFRSSVWTCSVQKVWVECCCESAPYK